MNSASLKGFPTMSAFPHKISSIVVSVGILALFLIYASWLLISQPMVSTNSEHPYNVDHSKKYVSPISQSKQSTIKTPHGDNVDVKQKNPSVEYDLQVPSSPFNSSIVSTTTKAAHEQEPYPILTSSSTKDHLFTDSGSALHGLEKTSPDENYSNLKTENLLIPSLLAESASKTSSDDSGSAPKGSENVLTSSLLAESTRKTSSDDSGCDLYHGNWYYDLTGPLYTNNTCPVLTQMQNCQGNGRPDKEYENYRWKPSQCDLPRFDPKKFLELMRGKTIALIGDSVARNQMESLLCILWQVEVPKNRGNRRMQRWYFRSNSVMIVRIWSSWLVHQTSEPFDFAPGGVVKLHLDAPDENFMEFLPTFDVIVLSSGHWFAKQSVYVLNNKIVGGQLWWPDKSRHQKINSIDAFGVSVETIISSIATYPNYTGIVIVRSYSPDHYEGGAWNTGGSCTGKDRPVKDGELVESEYTNIMHEKQVSGFNLGIKKQINKAKLRLMDITNAFEYRHDGHPGPYRNPDPNKITKRGPDGKPPPQDCLHWCMPGPVDTWNEIVLEIIQREYS